MRTLPEKEKADLLLKSLELSEAANELMSIDELQCSEHNVSEFKHHLEMAHKYLTRIIKENK